MKFSPARQPILALLALTMLASSNSSAANEAIPAFGPFTLGSKAQRVQRTEEHKYAIVSASGVLLTEAIWDDVKEIGEGLCAVRQGKKYGFVNQSGRMEIQPQFDNAGKFSDGMAPVAIAGKWGFIDKAGRFVIEPQYSEVENFSEGLACVQKVGKFGPQKYGLAGGKFGFVDKSGKFVIPLKYQLGGSFNSGIARVSDGISGGWSYIDKKGRVLFQRNLSGDFRNGFASFFPYSDGGHGFIDKTGKVVTNGELFDWVWDFSEGLAAVRTKNDKAGFIDGSGKFVIEPIYDWTSSFSEGLAAVGQDGKRKYIDKNGKTVIDLGQQDKLGYEGEFHDGLAVVKIDGTELIINRNGYVVGKIQPDMKVLSRRVTDGMITVMQSQAVSAEEKPVLMLPEGCE